MVSLAIAVLAAQLKADPVADLIKQAEQTNSDAIVVMVDGKVIVDRWFRGVKPHPIEAMSATKSMVNLAIGMLIKDGKIKSVEDPVSKYFPRYQGGGREQVTIRNLLDHTSGIEARRDTSDIYPSRDFVQNALEKPLVSPPGSKFFYNNRAVNLLAGLASKAAGERMDLYLKRKLFAPLGIKEFTWSLDRAGNAQGMAGFHVLPEDVAKIGNFVMNGAGGLLPASWIRDSTRPSSASLRGDSPCGWLWWPTLTEHGFGATDGLLERWKEAGIRDALIEKVRPLSGKPFAKVQDYYAATRALFKDDPAGMDELNNYFVKGKTWAQVEIDSGPTHSYAANGSLGQYLVIVPGTKIVAVRMRGGVNESAEEGQTREFWQFPAQVDELRGVTRNYVDHFVEAKPKPSSLAVNAGKFRIWAAPDETVTAAGVQMPKLKTLLKDARAASTQTMLIWSAGKPLVELRTGKEERLTPLGTATMSISALAVMALLDDHKIRSLDQPLADFFPEWRTRGDKRKLQITLRQVLSQTSGMETNIAVDLMATQGSAIQTALKSRIVTEPGKVLNINFRAVNLVAGVVRRVSGMSLQGFVKKRFFDPLGISKFEWRADPSGNGYVHTGLSLFPTDLAKIGQLLLDDGKWKGRQLVSAALIATFTQESGQYSEPSLALLWSIDMLQPNYRMNDAQLAEWRREGIKEATLAALEKTKPKFLNPGALQDILRTSFPNEEAFNQWFEKADWSKADQISQPGPLGFYAADVVGQYLVVDIDSGLVAVRTVGPLRSMTEAFPEFPTRISDLTEK